jgi:hypothetical protein
MRKRIKMNRTSRAIIRSPFFNKGSRDWKERTQNKERNWMICKVSSSVLSVSIVSIVSIAIAISVEIDQRTITGQGVSSQIARLYMHIGHMGESLRPLVEGLAVSPETHPFAANIRDAYGAWTQASTIVGDLSRRCNLTSLPVLAQRVDFTESAQATHAGGSSRSANASRKRSRRV